MAVLSNNNPTLADLSVATGPDGKVEPVVEILSEVNEILEPADRPPHHHSFGAAVPDLAQALRRRAAQQVEPGAGHR
jgi:hypothetical protein